jgi:hypothetical protein
VKTEQIRLTPTLRVESGPARKTAIARAKIKLADGKEPEAMVPELDKDGKADSNKQTRDSYVLVTGADGKPAAYRIKSHYKLGFRDALGKPIVDGEEFTYLDWYGVPVWYYYQLQDMPLADDLLEGIAKRFGVAVKDLTRDQIAEWFGLNSPDWVSKDAAGRWQVKRYATKGVKPTRDEALSAVAALKE